MKHTENRRTFLKKSITGAAAVSLGLSFIGSLLPASEAKAADVKNILQKTGIDARNFCDNVMPRAQLSLLASQIAIDKAVQKNTKEFAGFELMEATTVIKVLKELGTQEQTISKDGRAFIASLKTASGNAFDKLYMHAELSNHEFLRNLADKYVKEAKARNVAAEQEARHLAYVALYAFTEHVTMSKRIYGELTA